MLVAQLTDLHIKRDGRPAYKKVDTLKCLRDAITHINQLIPQPDLVVITGDLVDFGTDEEYQLLIPELKKLVPPVKIVPGNHDHSEKLRSACKGWVVFDATEQCHFIHEDDKYRLLGIDTSVLGKPYGKVSKSGLAWLSEQLKKSATIPTLLFMHHPPIKVGLKHMDVQNLLNSEELWETIGTYSNIKGIVAGHVHRPIFATWHHLPVWIGPSHSHAVTLDLMPDAPSSFSLEPRAIQLFRLTTEGIASHISYIADSDGPYPFFDTQNRLID